MRCAVTGGTGFIGRELVARLAAEHVVKVLTRRAVVDGRRIDSDRTLILRRESNGLKQCRRQ